MSLVINHSSLVWWGVGKQYPTNQEASDDECDTDTFFDDPNPRIEKLAPVTSEDDLTMQALANLQAWLLDETIDPGYTFEETEGDIDPAHFYALGSTDKLTALQKASKHNTYYVIAISVLSCFGTNTASYMNTSGKIDELVAALENKYPQFIRIYHALDGKTYLQKEVIEFIRDWVWSYGDAANAGNILYGPPDYRNMENWSGTTGHFNVVWDANTETNVCSFSGHAPYCGVRWRLNLSGIDSNVAHAFGFTAGLGNVQAFEILTQINNGEWQSITLPGTIDIPIAKGASSINIVINPDRVREGSGNFWVNNVYLSGGKGNYSWKAIINWFNENYGDFSNQSNVTYPVWNVKLKANFPNWHNAELDTSDTSDSGCYYPVYIPSFPYRDSSNKIVSGKYCHNSLEVKICGSIVPQSLAQSGTATEKEYNLYIVQHIGEGGIINS